jgi:hypothetical protein
MHRSPLSRLVRELEEHRPHVVTAPIGKANAAPRKPCVAAAHMGQLSNKSTRVSLSRAASTAQTPRTGSESRIKQATLRDGFVHAQSSC